MSGSLAGTLRTGRTLDYEDSKDRKISSLYLSIMDRMGTPLPRFGDATQQLAGI